MRGFFVPAIPDHEPDLPFQRRPSPSPARACARVWIRACSDRTCPRFFGRIADVTAIFR